MQGTRFSKLALVSFVSALGSCGLSFVPAAYSVLSILAFCLWFLTIFLGFAMFGRKGFWLLLGAPFALVFPALLILIGMGGLDRM